jgi:preprotein translocase subunit SecF
MEQGSEFRRYRILIPIPVILLALAVVVLVGGYVQTGEWFLRSVELKGGTLITVNNPGPVSLSAVESSLSPFGAVSVRELRGLSGSALSVEVGSGADEDAVVERLRSLGLNTAQISVETIGAALSESFWVQAQVALVAAFVLMSLIVFLIFRSAVPAGAVILAAASDIIATVAIMRVLGIELSFASLAALLTLIGYSVDTDVLLTTRVLRGVGTLRERIRGAMTTGLLMSFTAIGALLSILVFSLSAVLSQIALVLLIGLTIDIANTWIQNASILAWHAERRGIV